MKGEHFRRETVRYLKLGPGCADLRIIKQYSSQVFRPTGLREELECSTDHDREVYTVTVSGPVITSKGHDHQNQVGKRHWSTSWSGDPIDQVPPDLAALLWGPERLKAWVQDG